jgi:hypothetical protein
MKFKILILCFLCCSKINGYDQYENPADIKVKNMYDYTYNHNIPVEEFYKKPYYVSEQDWDINDVVHKANVWLAKRTEYTTEIDEANGGDYWMLPEEYISIYKRGDCDDHAISLGFITWTLLDIDDVFLYRTKNGDKYHLLAVVNGYRWDQNGAGGEINYDKVVWICHYTEAIWMAYYYHDSVGKYI